MAVNIANVPPTPLGGGGVAVGQGLVLNSSGQLIAGDARAGYWASLALAKFGCTPLQLACTVWEEFDNGASLTVSAAGTEAALACPSLDGSWASWSVGDGTATGRAQLRRSTVNAQTPIHFANMKTSTWMMVTKYRVTTTPGATMRAVIANGSVNVYAGISKSLSATKFVGLPGSGTILSTVSIDTGIHTVMFRNDPVGALAYLSVDGETEVSGSNAGLPTSADQLEFDLFTGAAEAQQILQIDYMGLFALRS